MEQDSHEEHEDKDRPLTKSEGDSLRETIKNLQEQLQQLQESITNRREISNSRDDVKLSDTNIKSQEDESVNKLIYEKYWPGLTKVSYLEEFCSSISLPGVTYITEREVPRLHRWLWVVLHVVALWISVSYIRNAFNQWQSSPIVLSINNSMTSVSEIPFPTITVCEPLKKKYKYPNLFPDKDVFKCYNDTVWLCGDDELKKLELAYLLLPFDFNEEEFNLNVYFQRIFLENTTFNGLEYLEYVSGLMLEGNYDLDSYDEFVHNLNPGAPDIHISPLGIVWCDIYNDYTDGPRYLESLLKFEIDSLKQYNQSILGKEHNEASLEYDKISAYYDYDKCDWSPEKMLSEDCRANSGIAYTKGPVKLNFVIPSRFDTNDPIVFVGSPLEYSKIKSENNVIPSGRNSIKLSKYKITRILLTPTLITAGKDLNDISIVKRDCVFSNEVKLSFFKFYTRDNCIFECQVNCALEQCGCIPPNVPVYNYSLVICGYYKSKRCNIGTHYLNPDHCGCSCPQDCVSLSYDIDTEVTDGSNDYSIELWIEYKDPKFASMFRYSITNSNEFIAYSLGILGVFSGFSMMLVWEIMYWLTLRLWTTVARINVYT